MNNIEEVIDTYEAFSNEMIYQLLKNFFNTSHTILEKSSSIKKISLFIDYDDINDEGSFIEGKIYLGLLSKDDESTFTFSSSEQNRYEKHVNELNDYNLMAYYQDLYNIVKIKETNFYPIFEKWIKKNNKQIINLYHNSQTQAVFGEDFFIWYEKDRLDTLINDVSSRKESKLKV